MDMQMTYEEAEAFFGIIYYGKHHIPYPIKPWGYGWIISVSGRMATFDFNDLTRLIFLAHDRCIRAEVIHGGPRRVRIAIWKRYKRDGSMMERHPTIEQALSLWREKHPESEVVKFK